MCCMHAYVCVYVYRTYSVVADFQEHKHLYFELYIYTPYMLNLFHILHICDTSIRTHASHKHSLYVRMYHDMRMRVCNYFAYYMHILWMQIRHLFSSHSAYCGIFMHSTYNQCMLICFCVCTSVTVKNTP